MQIRPNFSNGGNMKRQRFLANRFASTFGILLLIVTAALSALGQAGTSTVRGLVKDPQGDVVPGATVRLINPATNASRTTTSSGDGVFTFEQVAVSDYRLEVEAKGFKKGVITDFHAL